MAQRFVSPEIALPLLRRGGYAYHISPGSSKATDYILKNFRNKEICDLTEVHLVPPTYNYIGSNYNGSFVEIAKQR